MRAAHGFHAVHRAQVARVPLHQRWRQKPELEQLLRAVNIGHDVVQHAHTLFDANLDLLPAVGRQNQRKQIK